MDNNIQKVLIIVEMEGGMAHQVLSTNDHKMLALGFLSGLDDGLKLSKELEPIKVIEQP